MKISELITRLEKMRAEHGDLAVMVVRTNVYQDDSSLFHHGAIGGGGGGYSKEWYGTVLTLQVSDQYPDQLELIPTK